MVEDSIYVCIFVCVCVCLCVCERERERERGREGESVCVCYLDSQPVIFIHYTDCQPSLSHRYMLFLQLACDIFMCFTNCHTVVSVQTPDPVKKAATFTQSENLPVCVAEKMARNYSSWLHWWKSTVTTDDYMKYLSTQVRGSFHKAILATVNLSYLWLILRLPALIFTSVQRNNFKTIINPAHVEKKNLFHLTG